VTDAMFNGMLPIFSYSVHILKTYYTKFALRNSKQTILQLRFLYINSIGYTELFLKKLWPDVKISVETKI
jgi:hypothetical protein